jgi:hypothetical protein
MIDTGLLVDLARRFVLRDDEAIVWRKDFPDGPAVAFETDEWMFSVRQVRGFLGVERAAWVAGVVVATRDDVTVEGGAPRDVILVPRMGTPLHLNDATTAALLGVRVSGGDLEPLAYGEILVECHWPGGWLKRVVHDPVAWRAEYPSQERLPIVAAPVVRSTDVGHRLTFHSSRENTVVTGGRTVLDVAGWSVLTSSDAPASWQVRPVARAVPIQPPC